MAGPDPATTEWVPLWNPVGVGPIGPQGPQGIQGEVGPQGPIGLTGATGAQGIQGVKGDKGDKGDTGDTGPQGAQGIQGIQGPQGVQGPQGTAGENWFSGSGAPSGTLAGSVIGDWYLDSVTGDVYEKTGASAWTLRANIKGPQGVQGIQGIQGIQGPTGAPGATAAHAANHRPGGSDPLTLNAWTDVANVFTQDQEIQKQFPRMGWRDSAAAVDRKLWRWAMGSTQEFAAFAINDAASAVVAQPLTLYRTGELAVGGGIAFPATQLASAGANVLDDYEEGSWDPFFNGDSGNSTTQTYTARAGRYVKIGLQVTLWFDLQISTFSAAGGNLIIQGQPWTNDANVAAAGSIAYFDQLNGTVVHITPQINPGMWFMYLRYGGVPTGGPAPALQFSNMKAGTRMQGTITYRAAA